MIGSKEKPSENKAEAASLTLELDIGEAEAITLALELKADLLLIDERKGKLVADRLSVRNIGVLGVMIEAKHKRLIKTVKPLLDDLIVKAGFWFDKNTYDLALQKAGE
jgi:predicted nucleic acid-binding protein